MIDSTSQRCPACSTRLVIEASRNDPVILCASCGVQSRLSGAWPATRTSKRAIASFVLGIVSIGGLCFTAVPALFLGLWALHDIRRPQHAEIVSGKRYAVTGVVLGAIFSLAMFAMPLLAFMTFQRELKVSELEGTAQQYVRSEDWPAVADCYRQLLEIAPENEMHWLRAAAVNAQSDREGHGSLCGRMLLQFEDPKEVVADRIAKACLLLPPKQEHLETALRLAEQAVANNPEHADIRWFTATLALARYREGDYFITIQLCNEVRLGEGTDSIAARTALVDLIKAAALFRSGKHEEAREMLIQARATVSDFEESVRGWHDHLIAKLLLAEVEELAAASIVDP